MTAISLKSVPLAPATKRRRRIDGQLVLAIVILAIILGLAAAGLFLRDAANVVNIQHVLTPPGVGGHLLGTDAQGRDILERIAVGAGISIAAATVCVVFGAGIGLVIAIVCGLGPKWLDATLMRIMEAIMAFPDLLLAMAISIALGAGLESAVIGIIVTMIPGFARTLRSEAVRSRTEPFVEAAQTIGLTQARIAARHVVPYLSGTLSIQATANFGGAVLTLAALSFIGVGAQPPTPEWGVMITDGLQTVLTGQWWIGVPPGIALLMLVVALNLLTDRIRALLGAAGGR